MGLFGKPEERPAGAPAPAPPPRPAERAGGSAPTAPRGTSACVIGGKTVFKGEISGDEDVIIEGSVEGQIRISRDLRVAQGGSVKATIEAQSIVVSGEVVGDCTAAVRVEIQASGKLAGNIRAPKIVIAEGAVFRGNSDMGSRDDARRAAAPSLPAEKKVATS